MIDQLQCRACYHFAGLFHTDDEWIHPACTIDTYEIILMVSGCARLFEEDRRFILNAGEAVLLRPGLHHGGWQVSTGETSFFWIHFTTDDPPEDFPITPCAMTDPARMQLLCRQLLHTANAPGYPPYAVQAAFALLYCEFLQQCRTQDIPSRLVREAAEWIRINSDNRLTAESVAAHQGYHPDYLSSLFRKVTGISLKQYICAERMKRIRMLLLTTSAPLKEIAAQLAFPSEEHLTHFFRYHEGVSPSAYRNVHTYTHMNKK